MLTQASQVAVLLGKRPSEILRLEGSEAWLFEVDYQLVGKAVGNKDGELSGKVRKIREWRLKRLK